MGGGSRGGDAAARRQRDGGASLTKAAFAHLVLQLVDDGTLSLDAPITALLRNPLPDYDGFADLRTDPRWQRLTPRMLLSHTSGLLNWRWIISNASPIIIRGSKDWSLNVVPKSSGKCEPWGVHKVL